MAVQNLEGAEMCKRGHPYTPENTYIAPGRGWAGRMCRQCRRDTQTDRRNGRDCSGDADILATWLCEPERWMEQAACRGEPWEVFFPSRGDPVVEAKRICAACPVRAQCLDYALRVGVLHGIWGGTTEKQRRRLRRAS